jgi:drug/metabolite transporter (DMT)-like permease
VETRPTRAGRTRFLYFIPLVVLVLGFVFMAIANAIAQPYIPGGPITPEEDFFWTGALVLIGTGILGGIIAFGLYLWRTRATHASRQSLQAQDLPNRDLRGQRD